MDTPIINLIAPLFAILQIEKPQMPCLLQDIKAFYHVRTNICSELRNN